MGRPAAPADALPSGAHRTRGTRAGPARHCPALTRAERVAAVDAWLAGLLADAVAGTPPPQAAPGRPAAADRHRRARAGRRRQPRPPRAAAARRPRPRAGARGPARDRRRSPTRSGTRSGTPASGWTTPCARSPRPSRSPRPTSRPGSACSTPGSSPATPTSPPGCGRRRSASWRQAASRLLPQLRDLRRERARQLGELAFLLEPDLKEAYGGLREGQVLRAIAAAQLATSPAPRSRRPTRFLLDVRDELRRRTGRPHDVLVRQEQRPVADALGLADEDALLREVSLAGRRLAFVADETWRRVEAALVRRPRGRYRRVRREPLAEGVVRQGDEVVLARDAQPGRRPRAAAARRGRRGAGGPAALAVHAQGARGAQPAAARAVAGRGALVVPPAAGQRPRRRAGARAAGPGGPAVPAAPRVGPRALAAAAPPVAPVHRRPAPRRGGRGRRRADPRRRPARPAAGRRAAARHRQGLAGRPQRGRRADRAPRSPTRMGFSPPDVATLAALVRHHLLLPATATRRDIDDPATIDRVAATIGSDAAVLQLLHALAQADGAATSTSAWSPWKAHLVAALVARVQAKLGGAPARARAGAAPDRAAGHRAAARRPGATGAVTVGIEDVADGQQVTIGAPDRPGLLSICAGVLALNQLDVRAAKMSVEDGYATGVFAVRPALRPGPGAGDPRRRRCGPRWRARCRWPSGCGQREADYRQDGARSAPPRISWHNGEVSGAATGHRRGARRRPGRAALPADRRDRGGGPRRHLGADRDPRRRRRRLLLRVQPVGRAGGPRAAAAGRRGAGRRHARATPAAAEASTRRARSSVLSVGRATVGGAGTERSHAAREEDAAVDSRPWPCPTCGDDHATSCSRPAPTGTPTTAASAPSGPAPTAAPRCSSATLPDGVRRRARPRRRLSRSIPWGQVARPAPRP